jgi:tetratricopeptide (TPR) repeat protein
MGFSSVNKSLFRLWITLLLLWTSSVVYAQIIEDADLRQEGPNVVLQIRFLTPIHYTGRSVSSRSNDLIQAFYEIVPTKNMLSLMFGQRLVIRGTQSRGDITVTDESAGQGGERSRKLVIRFAGSTNAAIRAGSSGKSIEVVLAKTTVGQVQSALTESPDKGDASTAYAIALVTSTDRNLQLDKPIPSAYQNYATEVVSRVVTGMQRFEIQLGNFGTLDEAQKALAVLKQRFPLASLVTVSLAVPPMPEAAGSAPLSAAQIDERAASLLSLAKKAEFAGKLDQALELLNRTLDLPPNKSTREAQYLVGVVRIEQGDNDRGRTELELFIKQYPTGKDTDQARSILAGSLVGGERPAVAKKEKPATDAVVSGVWSTYFNGGESRVRTQEFADSVVSALPVLPQDSDISAKPQQMIMTNLDAQWRKRSREEDIRFVFRDSFQRNVAKDLPSTVDRDRNKLSALYFDYRSFTDGFGIKVGRQNPSGGGVIARFDGVQAGYSFLPKLRANVAFGKPSERLLDTQRYFYGASIDADSITAKTSGSFFINRQMIDGVVDRNAFGTELRYFDSGMNASFAFDYDTLLKVVNVGTLQGTWQSPKGTSVNFSFDRRMVSVVALSNALYYSLQPDPLQPNLPIVCPNGSTPPAAFRRISDLMSCYNTLDELRYQVHEVTAMYSQGSMGFTTPISSRWQVGSTVGMLNVGSVAPVVGVLPTGSPSTGDLWNMGAQMIGTNLYSSRDSHVYSLNYQSSTNSHGAQLSYNNMTSVGDNFQFEPALRYILQNDDAPTSSLVKKTKRVAPSLRMSYKLTKNLIVEGDYAYEYSVTDQPAGWTVDGLGVASLPKLETTRNKTYSIGARYDF